MRVTLGMQATNTARYLSDSAEALMNAQQTVTTGKKISKPSDDPTLAGRAMSIQSSIRGLGQYSENNNLAKSTVDMTEATVGSIEDQLQDLRGVINNAASTLQADNKDTFLAQIKNIKDQILSLSDTTYLGRRLFSGYKTNTPPLLATGATPPYTYQGDQGAIQLAIGPGQKVQTNVTADQLFNLDGSAGPGVKDVFSAIQDAEDAINASDVTAISNSGAGISDNINNMLAIRAQVGARSSMLGDNATALTDSSTRMTNLLSDLTNVDLPSAIINMQTQQNVYQAALSVASKTMQRSLVDYLSTVS